MSTFVVLIRNIMDIKKLIIEEIGLSNSYYEKVIEVSERLSLKRKIFFCSRVKYALSLASLKREHFALI